MMKPNLRPYHPKDKDACLAIFDKNVPKFFGATERGDFINFLDQPGCPYFVVMLDNIVIGCCGYGIEGADKDVGVFSWGMITPEHHGKSYGQMIVEERLELMRNDPQITSVRLNTSQHTAPFYARFGFETMKVTKDGFAEGLDDVEMRLIF